MHVQPARWSDAVDALALESAALGVGVAWDEKRARDWWDAGLFSTVMIKEGGRLVAYASAGSITPDAYAAIAEGRLNPEELDLAHGSTSRTHHWVGIVITHPEYQNRGAGRAVLEALIHQVGGQFVADVYSAGGLALVEKLGWHKTYDSEHPVYVTASSLR